MVRKPEFLTLLGRRAELGSRVLTVVSRHLRLVVGLLDDLSLKDVEARLAYWLLKRCPRPLPASDSVVIELDRTKRVLASELGTASETLSRTLAKLQKQGLVEVNGRRITVTQPLRLFELLERNLGAPPPPL